MTPSAPAQPLAGAASARPPARLDGLGNRFVELFGRKLTRDDFAQEVARLVAEAARGKAAAVLAYESSRDRLLLLGDHGLSNDARAALGNGGECGWDIPLRSIHNRRISVIAAAHQNPFVPRALGALSAGGLSIAFLPLYNGSEPAGLVMIFSGGRSAFPDAQLQTVGQALRVCARALREPLELGGHDTFFPVAGEGDVEATAPAPIAAPAGAAPTTGGRRSSSPLRSTPLQLVEGAAPAAVAATEDGSADGLARIRDLEAQLGRAREELERHAQRMRGLNAAANALERERDDLAQRMADRERERETESSELRAQVGALQERLLATESERARHQRIGEAQRLQNTQTITSLETERDTLLERARVAEACAAELQTALTTVRGERERFAVQTEKLSGQLRITHDAAERAQARHAQERGTIETDRNAWKEQAITLRSQLAERTDALATTDRELRSVKVAHEGATTQLQQAREELAQLTALTETLERTATERDAARLQALAEAAALRRTLEEERSNHRQAEQTFRDTLDNVHQEADRLWSEAAARRADLASRDATLQDREEQLARLREQLAAVQEAASALERANADRDAQISTLAAQLEQGNAERQQLAEDRTALRVTLAEVRQRAGQADVEHTTVLAQLQAESGQLRAQVEGLNSDRTALSTRLERAVEESKHLARRLGESQSRTEELGQLLRQRDASIEAVTLERQSLEGRVAALSGQLQAAQEAAERAATRGAQEYARLEAERDEWHTHTAAAQHELAERTQQVIALEGELRSTAVARDAAATDLEVAQTELARLTTQNEALARAAAQQESAQAESAALSAALEEERAARARIEQALRAELAAAVARSEHLSTSAAALRDELAAAEHAAADRDDHLNALGREIEALRQQSADRGVLAHHAAELDHRVVELEQLLAAARGTQEAAERHAAALAEKLDAAQRREADAAALATRQHTALHDEILGLTDERDRLRTEHAAAVHEIEAQRATLAALQAAEAQLRGERAHTEEERQATGRRLAAAQQGLAELRQTLLDRDTSLAAAVAERDRANAQLITLTADLETGLQAMTAAQQRWIEDRRALAGERDARQQALAAARAEAQRLTVALHEMRNRAAAAATARTTALAERAELHEALETERAMAAAGAERLRAEVAAVHAREEQLASEVLDLRTTLADRDTLLSVLQERGAADQEASGAAQRTAAALEARTAELAARLQQTIAEMEQLRESRATLEHQLALVTATHGEEEQALAQGMQAAREQVAQLEEERSTLRAALSELRQQLRRTETSHDAARTQLQGEVADWQRQVDGLTASRAALAEDLARAQEELAAQRQHTRAEGERAAALATQQVELQRALADQQAATDATLAEMRETLAARTAELEERAAQHEQLRELHTSVTQQLDALAADHDAQNAATALERETVHHRLRQLEEERAALQRAWSEKEQRFNDAAAAQRAALADARHETAELRDHVADLTASRESLRARLEATEAGVTAHRAELDAAAQQAAALGEQRTQLHEALRTADARRTALEAELGQARTEIDALRQQSADRGVLAHQASQLGNRVTELEQQLAAVRGDAARAERQRTALNEELEAARRLQADAETTATRKHAELRAALERLDDERQRLEKERAAALAEAEGQRATAADMQTRLLRAEQDAHTLAQRLAAAQQRSEELGSQLHERDATLDTAGAERTRLLAQVANLTGRIRADQETLESLQGRYALEHAALEAERNAWKDKVERGRDQSAQLATRHEQLTQTAADLEAARNAAVAENASLQRTLDELRAAYHQTETALRADLGATQSESERLAGEADALRDALAERTALLATVQQERDATRQADLASQQALSAVRAEVAANRAQLAEAGEDIQRLRAEREGVAQQLGARHQEQEALARAAREAAIKWHTSNRSWARHAMPSRPALSS